MQYRGNYYLHRAFIHTDYSAIICTFTPLSYPHKMKKLALLTGLFVLLAGTKTFAQTTIAAKDAAKHLNEKVTICEKVYGGRFLSSSDITLINLGAAHPNSLLT